MAVVEDEVLCFPVRMDEKRAEEKLM